jgi:predicted 3-demethylubiquinone-9 3-methyltransferase (glyoxalase superfamily)
MVNYRSFYEDQIQNRTLPLVRQPGRRCRQFLHRHLQGFEDRRCHPVRRSRAGSPWGKAGHRVDRGVRARGQSFTALNGGPVFKFNEAISLQITCESQEEIDHYWSKLTAGGDDKAQQCGWLKDKFGVSWQVVPRVLFDMLHDSDAARSNRAMTAMLKMKKFDIAELKRAYEGK